MCMGFLHEDKVHVDDGMLLKCHFVLSNYKSNHDIKLVTSAISHSVTTHICVRDATAPTRRASVSVQWEADRGLHSNRN